MKRVWALMGLLILVMVLPPQPAGALLIVFGATVILFSLAWLVGILIAGPEKKEEAE